MGILLAEWVRRLIAKTIDSRRMLRIRVRPFAEPTRAEDLSHSFREFLGTTAVALSEEGFVVVANLSMPKYSGPLREKLVHMLLVNRCTRERASAMCVRRHDSDRCRLFFVTEFTDGTVVRTVNGSVDKTEPSQPHEHDEGFSNIKDPRLLLAAHRQHVGRVAPGREDRFVPEEGGEADFVVERHARALTVLKANGWIIDRTGKWYILSWRIAFENSMALVWPTRLFYQPKRPTTARGFEIIMNGAEVSRL